MKQNDDLILNNDQNNFSESSDSLGIEVNNIPNAVLQRLIEEVKYESQNNISAYNRTHSRHNRGR
ncbi:hypothetical protein BH11BAC7_BH11BAC7_21760 [soil metagenome]